MKANLVMWMFLLLASNGCNQQSSSSAPAKQPTPSTNQITATKLIEETRANAEKGDAEAQVKLARIYSSGEGVPKNKAESLKWVTRAAEGSHAKAAYDLAFAYRHGWTLGVKTNASLALRWLKAAAERGDRDAQSLLADSYYNDAGPFSALLGWGTGQDFREAAKWYHKAAEQGNPSAQSTLGHMYLIGEGVPTNSDEGLRLVEQGILNYEAEVREIETGTNFSYLPTSEREGLAESMKMAMAINCLRLGDYFFEEKFLTKNITEAIRWYEKAANAPDNKVFAASRPQFQLGYIHATETKNFAEAVKWLRKAAEQNHAGAQNNLGFCYATGQGVAKDAVEAVKWYGKAAEQNHANAQYALGICYANGAGVAKDEVESVKWYSKAAQRGLAGAQFSLGACYHSGQGVKKDRAEAVKWYLKAAEQGEGGAQNNLAICYANGEGVPMDKIKAVKWYRKAADQGDSYAQSALGSCYGNGQGVPKDYVEAYKWINLSVAQGNENARENLSVLELGMTKEQVAEAQRLAREFRPRKTPELNGTLTREQMIDSRPSSSGTGFFISEDGFLITNEHVVNGATQIRLVTSAGLISAKVVKVDAANDLALLKAEGKFSALPVAASRGVKLGGTVATVGFPNIGLQGFAPKLAKGEIASLSGAGDDARYFQISVPVQPGNSGGALVDERGNVVGVVSAKLSARAALAASGALPENVNYAVKSSYLLSFLESVPEVSTKLKEPETKERKFEDVVKSAEQAAVLVLVY